MSFFCIILRLGTKATWDQEIVLTSVAKAIQGPSLSFECIDNISGKNCFPLGVLRVSHCVPHHVLQEHSEHSSHLKIAILVEYQLSKKKSCLSQEIKITELVRNLLIDEPWYSFDASPSRKTPYRRLCDPLDVVPQHLQPGAQVNTKDRVFRKSLLYLSVSLCSPLPKAFAPLAPPVIGHSCPFSSFPVRSEFRLCSDPFRIWTRQIPPGLLWYSRLPLRHYVGTEKKQKVKMFRPMRALGGRDDQWEET